jgi:hypothetical protein
METVARSSHILKAHLEALKAGKHEGDESTRVEEMIAFLGFALLLVDRVDLKEDKKWKEWKEAGTKLDELAEAAFPDLDGKKAEAAARALYQLISSQTRGLARGPVPLRAAGVGAALVSFGGGEMVYRDEMLAGKLKPGATLQKWDSGGYEINGKETYLSGKQVYQNLVKGTLTPESDDEWGGGVNGHSIMFVKYEEGNNNVIHFVEYYSNEAGTLDITGDSPYIVGTNLDTGGDAELSAEYILQDTRFQADRSKDSMVYKAEKYNLDASKLSEKLIAGIAASDHPDREQLVAAAGKLGAASEFDHDMARLIGLWQHASGIYVDGNFGNGSCEELIGKKLAAATELQTASVE